MELAGSLVALVGWLETRARCDSAELSSFKPTRSPSLTEGLIDNAWAEGTANLCYCPVSGLHNNLLVLVASVSTER